MAAGDIAAWRRQNSDVVPVVISINDGTVLRGTILLPRDKTLVQQFNVPEPFLEFDCAVNGETVLAKTSIVTLRKHQMPNADQLDKKHAQSDKAEPHRILGVGKTAPHDEVHAAYLALARVYHPDRFAAIELPAEVSDYLETMSRRINIAYSELAPAIKKDAARETAKTTKPQAAA